MRIEKSYFPEQVRSDRSAYEQLRQEYVDDLQALTDALAGAGDPDDPGYGSAGHRAHSEWTPTFLYASQYGMPVWDWWPEPENPENWRASPFQPPREPPHPEDLPVGVEPASGLWEAGDVENRQRKPWRVASLHAARRRTGLMPRAPFSIQTTGADKAAKSINDTGKRADNAKPAAAKIRTAYREVEAEIFARDGGAVAWKKLEDSTREAKRRRNQDHGILRASGALYKALTAQRAKYQVDDRQPHELKFGTTLPYAEYHEVGKGQAKRPTQAFTVAQQRRINEAISDYIATGDTT
jgi:hypothetical protein